MAGSIGREASGPFAKAAVIRAVADPMARDVRLRLRARRRRGVDQLGPTMGERLPGKQQLVVRGLELPSHRRPVRLPVRCGGKYRERRGVLERMTSLRRAGAATQERLAFMNFRIVRGIAPVVPLVLAVAA